MDEHLSTWGATHKGRGESIILTSVEEKRKVLNTLNSISSDHAEEKELCGGRKGRVERRSREKRRTATEPLKESRSPSMGKSRKRRRATARKGLLDPGEKTTAKPLMSKIDGRDCLPKGREKIPHENLMNSHEAAAKESKTSKIASKRRSREEQWKEEGPSDSGKKSFLDGSNVV